MKVFIVTSYYNMACMPETRMRIEGVCSSHALARMLQARVELQKSDVFNTDIDVYEVDEDC